jgi:hypothetical protein
MPPKLADFKSEKQLKNNKCRLQIALWCNAIAAKWEFCRQYPTIVLVQLEPGMMV